MTTFDGKGLSLRVYGKTGAKSWLYQYTFNKRRTSMTFGSYPNDYTLATARDQVRFFEKENAKGRDPKIVKKIKKEELTEESLYTMVSLKHKASQERIDAGKWSDSHIRRTEMTWKHLRPIYDIPITELSKRRVRDLLVRINTEVGTSTAQKCKTLLSTIYTYAVVNEIVDANLISSFARDPILEKPKEEDIEKHPSIPDDRIGEVFSLIDEGKMDMVTKYALHMIAYTGLRVRSLMYGTKGILMNKPQPAPVDEMESIQQTPTPERGLRKVTPEQAEKENELGWKGISVTFVKPKPRDADDNLIEQDDA